MAYDDDVPLVRWTRDSGGVMTIHRNGPNLKPAQSQLGYIVSDREKQNWGYVLGDGERVMVGSYARAQKALETLAIALVKGS